METNKYLTRELINVGPDKVSLEPAVNITYPTIEIGNLVSAVSALFSANYNNHDVLEFFPTHKHPPLVNLHKLF